MCRDAIGRAVGVLQSCIDAAPRSPRTVSAAAGGVASALLPMARTTLTCAAASPPTP